MVERSVYKSDMRGFDSLDRHFTPAFRAVAEILRNGPNVCEVQVLSCKGKLASEACMVHVSQRLPEAAC